MDGHVEGDDERHGERVEDRDQREHQPFHDVIGFGVERAGDEAVGADVGGRDLVTQVMDLAVTLGDGLMELLDLGVADRDLALALFLQAGELPFEVGDRRGSAPSQLLLLGVDARELFRELLTEARDFPPAFGVEAGLFGAETLDAGGGFGQLARDRVAFGFLLGAQLLALAHVVLVEEEELAGRALRRVGRHGLVEHLDALVEHGDVRLLGGDGFGERRGAQARALRRGGDVGGAAGVDRAAFFLQADEGGGEHVVGLGQAGLRLDEVLAAGRAEAVVAAARVVDAVLDVEDLLLERRDLELVALDLRRGLLVGAREVAVVAERGDPDEQHDRQRQVEAHRAVDAVPVAVEEGGGDELADLEGGGHHHDRDLGADEEEAQSADGEERRAARDEERGGDQDEPEAPG